MSNNYTNFENKTNVKLKYLTKYVKYMLNIIDDK